MEKNNTQVTTTTNTQVNSITSLEIAEMMGTEHGKIIRKLEGDETHIGIIPVLSQAQLGVSDYFIESVYKDTSGKSNKCYLVTKLGCDFLANKFTGEKGIIFTAKYVKRFREMEQMITSTESQKQQLCYMIYRGGQDAVSASKQLTALEVEEATKPLHKEIECKQEIIEHKQEVINGLTDDIDIYKKKDIINRICRQKHDNYANRYNELYKCFKETYHIDLLARCEGYNLKQTKKKDQLSTIKYAEKFGYIDDLYSCCVKLYEVEVRLVLNELDEIHR